MRDGYERILVLVIDGLRPDAITPVYMPNLTTFSEWAWQPAVASTVRPSITVAALSSLGTGVGPETHGLVDPSLNSLARLLETVSTFLMLERIYQRRIAKEKKNRPHADP